MQPADRGAASQQRQRQRRQQRHSLSGRRRRGGSGWGWRVGGRASPPRGAAAAARAHERGRTVGARRRTRRRARRARQAACGTCRRGRWARRAARRGKRRATASPRGAFRAAPCTSCRCGLRCHSLREPRRRRLSDLSRLGSQAVKASEARKYIPPNLNVVELFGYTLGRCPVGTGRRRPCGRGGALRRAARRMRACG
eukprot:scaffold2272_cov297-Prasinococcus_capsulatus_cf.AAC.4